MNGKPVLVTGCSSGIGYACAKGLKARGYRVIATARKPEDVLRLEREGLECVPLEYADAASVAQCVEEVAKRTSGKLFALFNNGAYGLPGAVEDVPRGALEDIFASNVFGWHDLTRRCLPLIRANGGGRIINNSSVLGLVAMKWRGAYNATKFAIEALSDTLRLEVRSSGIHVVLIEPGPIKSRFVEHALAAFERNIDEKNSYYQASYARQRARLGRGGSNRFKLPPEAVFEKLILALERDKPAARYYVTKPTYLMAWSRRFLPQRILDKVIDKASDQ